MTRGTLYKAVADDAVPLEDGNGALGMVVVVVVNEVGIRHAVFLLDVDGGLDHLSEACRVRVTCFECSGHHVGEGEGVGGLIASSGAIASPYCLIENPGPHHIYVATDVDHYRTVGSRPHSPSIVLVQSLRLSHRPFGWRAHLPRGAQLLVVVN